MSMFHTSPSGRRKLQRKRSDETLFDLQNSKVRITHLSKVWELYEEDIETLEDDSHISKSKPNPYIPRKVAMTFAQICDGFPFFIRTLQEIRTIPGAWPLVVIYTLIHALQSLIPAWKLWFSGQMLTIIQKATEERQINQTLLWQALAGLFICDGLNHLSQLMMQSTASPLRNKLKVHYSHHLLSARARLDTSTYQDTAVLSQLSSAEGFRGGYGGGVVFECLTMILGLGGLSLRVIAEVSALLNILSDQTDGPLLAAVSLVDASSPWIVSLFAKKVNQFTVWAGTTKNADYIRLTGIERSIRSSQQRKEMTASGNMAPYLLQEYGKHLDSLREDAIVTFHGAWWDFTQHNSTAYQMLSWAWKEGVGHLPQMVFIWRTIQHPTSVPASVAGLELIKQTVRAFWQHAKTLSFDYGSIGDQLHRIKAFYECGSIQNQIADGTVGFPEDRNELKKGLSIEFRNVTFKYPGTDNLVLDNVSFKIEQGELCVIVGTNGSGKSTILKLMSRIYDPTDGVILVNDKELTTLKLEDVRDNIAIGDPQHAHDDERVQEAARLGGADEIIERLPEKFETYLDPPVQDQYSSLPEGTKTVFGKKVNYNGIRKMARMKKGKSELSGGQMQRLALARTFMRSLPSHPNDGVGLLLFDEPSAALDPVAESDLFQRLRKLRGNKSMIFSSHRFGNLTRHADLILYMNDAKIVESGRHDDLVQKDGEYARIWKLSTEAFLS